MKSSDNETLRNDSRGVRIRHHYLPGLGDHSVEPALAELNVRVRRPPIVEGLQVALFEDLVGAVVVRLIVRRVLGAKEEYVNVILQRACCRCLGTSKAHEGPLASALTSPKEPRKGS